MLGLQHPRGCDDAGADDAEAEAFLIAPVDDQRKKTEMSVGIVGGENVESLAGLRDVDMFAVELENSLLEIEVDSSALVRCCKSATIVDRN